MVTLHKDIYFMIGNYKVKMYIPGGRRQYMELLLPQLFRNNGFEHVDEIMILNNARKNSDKEYIDSLNGTNKIVVYKTDNVTGSFNYICDFYRNTCDEDTIYIKIDDDIVFIDDNLIETLLKAKISKPDSFCIFPITINNAFSNCVLKHFGKEYVDFPNIPQPLEYHDFPSDYLYESNEGATKCHNNFFETYPHLDKYMFDDCYSFAKSRMSINCICYWGGDFKKIFNDGHDLRNDEQVITRKYPQMYNKFNCLIGTALCCHYSFGFQHLNDDLLEGYRKIEKQRLALYQNNNS